MELETFSARGNWILEEDNGIEIFFTMELPNDESKINCTKIRLVDKNREKELIRLHHKAFKAKEIKIQCTEIGDYEVVLGRFKSVRLSQSILEVFHFEYKIGITTNYTILENKIPIRIFLSPIESLEPDYGRTLYYDGTIYIDKFREEEKDEDGDPNDPICWTFNQKEYKLH